MSDFLVDAARRAAELRIAETQIIRLSLEAQERVVAIFSNPPAPSAGFDRAMAAHAALIRESK